MEYLPLLFVLLAVGSLLPSSHGQITDFIVPDFKATWFDAAKHCYQNGWMLGAVVGAEEERRAVEFAQRNSPLGRTNPRFWVAENDQETDAEFCPQITLRDYVIGDNDCMEMLYFLCESVQ